MLQHLPQLTDLLAKVLKKLIVNLTMAINSASSIARTWIPDIFDGMDLEKLNSFFFQCQLYFYANLVQFSINVTKVNFAIINLMKVVQS